MERTDDVEINRRLKGLQLSEFGASSQQEADNVIETILPEFKLVRGWDHRSREYLHEVEISVHMSLCRGHPCMYLFMIFSERHPYMSRDDCVRA